MPDNVVDFVAATEDNRARRNASALNSQATLHQRWPLDERPESAAKSFPKSSPEKTLQR